MDHLKGLLISIMGIGLVLVALQGAVRGWLPNGPKGFEQGEGVSRETNPLGFWFFFLLYAGGGIAVTVYALRHF
ncbi:MAG TPA: hypothetical protein VGN70_05915 [Gammaproteobacteria bacterium]|jgi:hypothetical protein